VWLLRLRAERFRMELHAGRRGESGSERERGSARMNVEEASGGVNEGSTVAVEELGLPVKGTGGLLIVFWKEQCTTCRKEAPAIRRIFERFSPHGLEVVHIGAFEAPDACQRWQEELDLPFPVIPDEEGELFLRLTTGWVSCGILVGPDGKVVHARNEFNESGFTEAISKLYASLPPT
jgi:peroxiredoxin